MMDIYKKAFQSASDVLYQANSNKPTNIREQLETLVIQNFKDAWEEGLSKHIQDLMEQDILEADEQWLREQDWTDLKADFLEQYLMNLGELIMQKSGLFERKGN